MQVTPDMAPDYLDVIAHPIDLGTMKEVVPTVEWMQGYLAHKKPRPCRTLQYHYA